MKEQYLHNIIGKFIKKEMTSVLDVGCQYGSALFPFEEKNFKIITGIDCDEEIGDYIFVEYLSSKKDYPSHIKLGDKIWRTNDPYLTNKIAKKHRESEYLNFKKRFEFIIDNEKGKIENFDLTKRSYDIIIFSQILHFFAENQIKEIIEKGLKCLKNEGFIYFDFYTEDSVKKGDIGYEYVSDNVFIETAEKRRKYYLLRHSFIEEIRSMFSKTIDIENNETRACKIFIGNK